MQWSQSTEGTVQSVVNKWLYAGYASPNGVYFKATLRNIAQGCFNWWKVSLKNIKHVFTVSRLDSKFSKLQFLFWHGRIPQCGFNSDGNMKLLGRIGTVLSNRGKENARGLASGQHCNFAGLCRSQLLWVELLKT